MELWYSIYPDSEKFEIRQRLKSDFQPAFYELGMHAYFKNQGFDLTIHPKLPNTTKHPDFLVKKDSDDFYVEIKEMRMFSDAERLLAKQKNTLLDSLNRIDSTNFLGVKLLPGIYEIQKISQRTHPGTLFKICMEYHCIAIRDSFK